MTTVMLLLTMMAAAALGVAWAITEKPLFGFAAWGAILLFVLIAVSGCSLSVAGHRIVSIDDGVASRTVGGAAVGAAAGAVGGAIAGNPGKGAAIGAAAGGVVGFLSGVFGGLEWSCDRLPEGPRRQGCLEGLAERQAYLACLESASGYCAGNPGSYECSRRRWECRVTHGRNHHYGGGWGYQHRQY